MTHELASGFWKKKLKWLETEFQVFINKEFHDIFKSFKNKAKVPKGMGWITRPASLKIKVQLKTHNLNNIKYKITCYSIATL